MSVKYNDCLWRGVADHPWGNSTRKLLNPRRRTIMSWILYTFLGLFLALHQVRRTTFLLLEIIVQLAWEKNPIFDFNQILLHQWSWGSENSFSHYLTIYPKICWRVEFLGTFGNSQYNVFCRRAILPEYLNCDSSLSITKPVKMI